MMQTDLFGKMEIQRSAHFLCDDVRIRLTRNWGIGPRAFVLGCNPSNADTSTDDPTSKWWNRWFMHYGYGGYDAGNLYPFVSSSPKECRKMADWENNGPDWYARDTLLSNLSAVVEMAKAADAVFVCFGNIAWDDSWVENVIEEIQTGCEPWPNLWCWGKTKSGAPTHPMARGKHRLDPLAPPILWRGTK